MATKTKTFTAAGATGVTVYATTASGASIPVRIDAGDTFQTSDPEIIAALQGSPEVVEQKAKK